MWVYVCSTFVWLCVGRNWYTYFPLPLTPPFWCSCLFLMYQILTRHRPCWRSGLTVMQRLLYTYVHCLIDVHIYVHTQRYIIICVYTESEKICDRDTLQFAEAWDVSLIQLGSMMVSFHFYRLPSFCPLHRWASLQSPSPIYTHIYIHIVMYMYMYFYLYTNIWYIYIYTNINMRISSSSLLVALYESCSSRFPSMYTHTCIYTYTIYTYILYMYLTYICSSLWPSLYMYVSI
jgi:hypothetical protein